MRSHHERTNDFYLSTIRPCNKTYKFKLCYGWAGCLLLMINYISEYIQKRHKIDRRK